MQEFVPTKFKLWRLHWVIACRLGCVSGLWLVLNLFIPGLRRAMLFGLLLWKWSLLPIMVSLGYFCTCIVVIPYGDFLAGDFFGEASKTYYFIDGLVFSASSFLYFGWILVAWMLYFGTDQGLNPSPFVDKYVTWTLVSLLVGAILWVLKKAVVLHWKAKAIYGRFKGRILMAGFQLYFLSIIIEGLRCPWMLPWRYEEKDGKWVVIKDDTTTRALHNKAPVERKSVQDYMSRHVSLKQLAKVACCLMDLAQVTLREDDDVSDIIHEYQQKIGANNESEGHVTEEAIQQWTNNEDEDATMKWTNNEDAKLLIEQLQAEFPSKGITEVPFLKWMVDAHKNCLSMGYTLTDAFAVVKVLDTVLTCFLVAVITLFWLLATELATTKVLVVLASQLLALTFMFGDTSKTFLQGVIFSFVTHPFDVGDRCIIDGVEVEIKRIGIMMTACFKIGTNEKLLYPNSNLVTKVIVNLEGKPDPSDVIELVLSSTTKKSQILRLRKSIRNFLKNDDQRSFYEKPCEVIVNEIGNSIKMSIHFKHTLNVQDVSYSQFIKKKNRGRSRFVIKIKKFMEDLKVTAATS